MNVSHLKQFSEEYSPALIVSEENIKYYTGFSSSNGWLIAARGKAYFFTDSRYIEAAKAEITSVDEVLETKGFRSTIAPFIEKLGINRLSVEQSRLTLDRLESFKSELPGIEFDTSSSLDDEINSQRRIKTKAEIGHMRGAQRIAERAFDHILNFIKPGVSEKDVQLELDFFMLKNGADALSFETIAVAGSNGSKPHGVPGANIIKDGDFVTMDYGAVLNGYHSDMTRTVAVGHVSDKMVEVYNTVLEAQLKGIEAIRPGSKCKDVDAAARDVIKAAGYGDCFGHGFGHGVGIEIHEHPFENISSDEILEKGNVVTAEPGIYIPGIMGVRIEDMLVVTDGGNENLTECEKKLIVL